MSILVAFLFAAHFLHSAVARHCWRELNRNRLIHTLVTIGPGAVITDKLTTGTVERCVKFGVSGRRVPTLSDNLQHKQSYKLVIRWQR